MSGAKRTEANQGDRGTRQDWKGLGKEKDSSRQLKTESKGFPGSSGVKNLPANAGLAPWSGRLLHALELLSPCATATEPVL